MRGCGWCRMNLGANFYGEAASKMLGQVLDDCPEQFKRLQCRAVGRWNNHIRRFRRNELFRAEVVVRTPIYADQRNAAFDMESTATGQFNIDRLVLVESVKDRGSKCAARWFSWFRRRLAHA